VLNGEQPEQQQIDGQGRADRPGLAAVDRFRDRQVADEGDGVKKRCNENEIGDRAIKKGSDPGHDEILRARR
jgi:hypothetical protein